MPSPIPIFAFELLHPAMLWWVAAAAVPLLIHLWNRRQHREMHWAAMEYLLAAVRASRRRIQIEQWLLLLVRTLLVALLVFAISEPVWESYGVGASGGGRTHRVLVIDGSFSMGYKPTDKTRFDRAKEVAAQIVDESAQGDGFTLVLMGAPPRVVVGNPVFEPRDFLREIDALRLGHTTADIRPTLAKVEELLVAARRQHPRLTREEVYFLTDLGRVGWAPDPREPATADFRQRAKRLAETAALVVVDLGQPGAENAAVTGVRAGESLVTVAGNVDIEAQVKNFGRQSRSRQGVELLVDGRRVEQKEVSLAAGEQQSVGFSYRFDAPGDHALEVRISGDQLDVDNHRFLVLPVKEAVSVLCVDGRPSGEPFRSATDFLKLALSPRESASGTSLVRTEVVPESGLLESDLDRYDCVFLCNVAQFTSSEAKLLDAYLQDGGGLVFFLGDAVLADRYNGELLGDGSGRTRLLPARLGPTIARRQDRLDPLGYRHPIVQAFRGRERAGLLTTPVAKYIKLLPIPQSKAEVALALGNGDPLVVEEPIRRGRVVLVATSADASWTPMPMLPSYLPLVQEILACAVEGQVQQRNLLVGQALGASVPAAVGAAPLALELPEGRAEPLRMRTEGDASTWSYADTYTSGVYTARYGPPISRADAYAVNVDTVESDLTALTPEELRDEVLPGVPLVHRTTWENAEGQPVSPGIQRSGLTKSLLYGVLILLFVETLLARFLGRPSL